MGKASGSRKKVTNTATWQKMPKNKTKILKKLKIAWINRHNKKVLTLGSALFIVCLAFFKDKGQPRHHTHHLGCLIG